MLIDHMTQKFKLLGKGSIMLFNLQQLKNKHKQNNVFIM